MSTPVQQQIIREDFARLPTPTGADPPGTAQSVRCFDPGAPLNDATPEQLNAGFAENLFALFQAMTALPVSELDEQAQISRHLAFPTHPMFKGAWRAHCVV